MFKIYPKNGILVKKITFFSQIFLDTDELAFSCDSALVTLVKNNTLRLSSFLEALLDYSGLPTVVTQQQRPKRVRFINVTDQNSVTRYVLISWTITATAPSSKFPSTYVATIILILSSNVIFCENELSA